MSLLKDYRIDSNSKVTCRICRQENSFNDHIELNESWTAVFEFTLNIVITPEAPLTLCKSCSTKLETFKLFKEQCQDSEKYWKSILDEWLPSINNVGEENKKKVKVETQDLNEDQNTDLDFAGSTADIDDYNLIYIQVNSEAKYNVVEIKPEINNEHKKTNERKQSKKIFQCDDCCMEFKSKVKLRHHILNVCGKSEKNICGLCKDDVNRNHLKQHLEEHRTHNILSCKLCEYNGRDFADMVSHRLTHLPKKKGRSVCYMCKKLCLTSMSLEFHFRSAHLKKKGGLCSACNKTFSELANWRKHQRRHTSPRTNTCHHCGSKFLFKHELKIHLRTHDDAKSYICELCAKGFTRESSLKLHISSVHGSTTPLQCEVCHKSFKLRLYLQRHSARAHGARPHACRTCAAAFPTERDLRRHQSWHSDDKPFECDICPMRFKAKMHLKSHQARHAGARPYACGSCSATFASSTQRARHRAAHSARRPHACPLCDASYYTAKLLRAHRDAAHPAHTAPP